MGPLGFEGALANSYSPIHRHDFCLSSAAILPFFVSSSASLAGEMRHESKRSKMSPLRKTTTQRSVERTKRKCSYSSQTPKDRRRQMQNMRGYPSLQRWKTLGRRGRRVSALPMLRMRVPVFGKASVADGRHESRNQMSTMWKPKSLGTWAPPRSNWRQEKALPMQRVRPFLYGTLNSTQPSFFASPWRRLS